MNESNRGRAPLLPATVSKLDLGRFPLGSPESRATARHLLVAREMMQPEGTLFSFLVIGKPPSPDQTCNCPQVPPGTFSLCTCFDVRKGS
jgi:hypothetical protein